MLEAISKAKHRVYLSTFIFGNDFIGALFIKTINKAAVRGCEVKILLDGIGSFFPIKGWRKKLHPTIKLAYFLSSNLLPPQLSINLRNYRKIIVCDSNIAFTGGMNISQHHLVTLKKPNRVQDIHFYCAGPIAKQLEIAFLLDWSFTTGEIDNDYTLMGSANLDPRSLNLNFELVVENFSTTLTNNLIKFFDKKNLNHTN